MLPFEIITTIVQQVQNAGGNLSSLLLVSPFYRAARKLVFRNITAPIVSQYCEEAKLRRLQSLASLFRTSPDILDLIRTLDLQLSCVVPDGSDCDFSDSLLDACQLLGTLRKASITELSISRPKSSFEATCLMRFPPIVQSLVEIRCLPTLQALRLANLPIVPRALLLGSPQQPGLIKLRLDSIFGVSQEGGPTGNLLDAHEDPFGPFAQIETLEIGDIWDVLAMVPLPPPADDERSDTVGCYMSGISLSTTIPAFPGVKFLRLFSSTFGGNTLYDSESYSHWWSLIEQAPSVQDVVLQGDLSEYSRESIRAPRPVFPRRKMCLSNLKTLSLISTNDLELPMDRLLHTAIIPMLQDWNSVPNRLQRLVLRFRWVEDCLGTDSISFISTPWYTLRTILSEFSALESLSLTFDVFIAWDGRERARFDRAQDELEDEICSIIRILRYESKVNIQYTLEIDG